MKQRTKKLIALLAVAAMSVSILAGCGGAAAPAATTAEPAAEAEAAPAEEAAPEETEISIVSEDEEENGYFFEEDIAYGDPAEPPLDNEPLEEDSKNS